MKRIVIGLLAIFLFVLPGVLGAVLVGALGFDPFFGIIGPYCIAVVLGLVWMVGDCFVDVFFPEERGGDLE